MKGNFAFAGVQALQVDVQPFGDKGGLDEFRPSEEAGNIVDAVEGFGEGGVGVGQGLQEQLEKFLVIVLVEGREVEDHELNEQGLVEHQNVLVKNVQTQVEEFLLGQRERALEEAGGVAPGEVDTIEEKRHLVVHLASHVVVEVEEERAVHRADFNVNLRDLLKRET